MSASFFLPTGELRYQSPHYYPPLSHNPRGPRPDHLAGVCVLWGILDRKEWPSAWSLSAPQHLPHWGTRDFFFLPRHLQSHHCYVYEIYWYGPDAGKQLTHLFLFEDKPAFILTLSTSRHRLFFPPKPLKQLILTLDLFLSDRRKQALWPVSRGWKKGSAERKRRENG